jgi:hypothetical protein
MPHHARNHEHNDVRETPKQICAAMLPDFLVYFTGYIVLCSVAVGGFALCASLLYGWKDAGLRTQSSFTHLTMRGAFLLYLKLRKLLQTRATVQAAHDALTRTSKETQTPAPVLKATVELQTVARTPVRRRHTTNVLHQADVLDEAHPCTSDDLRRILEAAAHDCSEDFVKYATQQMVNVREPAPEPAQAADTRSPPMLRQSRWRDDFTHTSHPEPGDVTP